VNSLFQWLRRTVVRLSTGRGTSLAAIVFAKFALTTIPSGFLHAAEVAGVKVDPKVRVGGVDLVLNGAGLRRRFMTDVYIIGLYFSKRTTDSESAIDSAGPKRIALTFMRDVTAQSLVDALYEGVQDNTSRAEFARLKPSADALSAIMLPLGLARKGDVVALDYLPNVGAQVIMNGRVIGRPVPGHNLYRALLRIWLGDSPVDLNLKQALLAGAT
jgi:long-chain acyl-CoA synthetase